jgi:hypothetical protein
MLAKQRFKQLVFKLFYGVTYNLAHRKNSSGASTFSRPLSSARLAFNGLVALEAVHHATEQLPKRRRL